MNGPLFRQTPHHPTLRQWSLRLNIVPHIYVFQNLNLVPVPGARFISAEPSFHLVLLSSDPYR